MNHTPFTPGSPFDSEEHLPITEQGKETIPEQPGQDFPIPVADPPTAEQEAPQSPQPPVQPDPGIPPRSPYSAPSVPQMPNYRNPQDPYSPRAPYTPPGQIPLQREPSYPPLQDTPYGNRNPNTESPYGNSNVGPESPYGNSFPNRGTPYGGGNQPYGYGGFGNVPPANFPPSGNFYSMPPKKKKSGGGKLAIIIVCCVLAGILTGVLASTLMSNSEATSVPSEDAPTISTAPSTPTIGRPAPTEPSTPRETQPLATASGEQMTLNQIYASNVPAIVGISNESTQNVFGQTTTAASTGSGFIISSDGEILTNYHVVEGAERLMVTLHDGREFPATLIGYEAESDVALIKIEAKNLPVCAIGNSDHVYVGEQIAAIGNPMGELTYSMTVGYVSAVNRFVNTDGTPINMIQVDAAINPGNSGGPVFNLYGEVIGIATAKYSGTLSGGATLEGLGFAIPINDIVEILNDLRINGKVPDRAYMGVMVSMLPLDQETYGIDHGVFVQSVDEGGSAYNAGVQANDIITKIGDVEILAYENLQQTLRKYRAGDKTTITVYRNGQTITLPIVFDTKPETTKTPPATAPQTTEPVEPTVPGEEETPWGTFPWEDFPWGDFGG